MNRFVVLVLGSVVLATVTGCATRTKPDYEMITNFTPDCKNEAAQIRFLTKLKRYKTTGDVSDKKFDTTVDIQIERLQYYCRYE